MTDDPLLLTRRQAIAAAGATGMVLAAGPLTAQPAAAAETARGVVFDDAGSNGTPGAGRSGIAGVLVSNGRDVAVTDAQGRWSLPVAVGQSLFVIQPAGWALPVDPATNLPRFARIHQPEGTQAAANFRFAGVAPTGKLPDSIDFPLRRREVSPRFTALLFTDPQPESLAEVGFIRDAVVAQTAGVAAAFGITHGDVMFDDLAHYDRYNRIVGTIGVLWFNCCGNHDMNFEAPDNKLSRETFKRTYGARWMAFQHGSATFFVLDNVEYLGTDPAQADGGGKYRGRFGEEQLAFVRNVLAHVPRDGLVVFSFHIPLKTQQGSDPGTANTDTREFLEAIASHPNSVSFSGHTHTNEHWYFGAAEGFAAGANHHHHVLAAVSGSWWSGPFDERGIPIALQSDGTPSGFHVLEIDGTTCSTRFVPAADPNRGQLRIVLDSQLHGGGREVMRDYPVGALLRGPIAQAAAGSTRVVVNFFDGGPRSKVEMAIGGEEHRPMVRTVRTDPFVVEVYARNEATKKPWVKPARSTHIWQATLPAGLAAGTHRLDVRAIGEYGRQHEGFMVLEVTG